MNSKRKLQIMCICLTYNASCCIATNNTMHRMRIVENREYRYCYETNAYTFPHRVVEFWKEINLWLRELGYQRFRLEQKETLAVLIGKIIYKNRTKRFPYSF